MTGPLRLEDLGILRAVMPLPDGSYHVTLDRVVRSTTDLINNNPATYSYDIPTAALTPGHPPTIGALIDIFTNGKQVTGYQLPPQ